MKDRSTPRPTSAWLAFAAALLCLPAAAQQEQQPPARLAVLQPADSAVPVGTNARQLAGARQFVDRTNADGGIDGARLELGVHTIDTDTVEDVVDRVLGAGAIGILAPLHLELAEQVRKACDDRIACVSYGTDRDAVLAFVDRLCSDTLLLTDVGLANAGDREARAVRKALDKNELLTPPNRYVLEVSFRIRAKKLAKELEETPIELLIVDGEADDAAAFLTEHWTARREPIVLTPRAFGPRTAAFAATTRAPVFTVLGRSPATVSGANEFRKVFEPAHGLPGHGAAQGYEAAQLIARALDATDGGDAAAIAAKIGSVVAEGTRGRIALDPDAGVVRAPLAVWRVTADGPVPYVPRVIPLETAELGTSGPERKPDPDLGEPLGKWRTRQFELEPGTQWVVCSWGPEEKQTIDEDLRLLGLSTQGESPLIDRIIKDEIMARVIAITSTKFGRKEDGTSVPGKSLRISFATYAPDVKKRRMWPAYFAGDDEGAGGRAFGTYCEIYTSFIRRTIFQPHALTPPISAEDMVYIDGTYVFGTDHIRDKRSELIRALINGYSGSMALTTAHEVGHLCGLGHIVDDPTGIMNVAEGAGLDYRDANFSSGSWEKLVEALGISGEEEEAGRRRRGN